MKLNKSLQTVKSSEYWFQKFNTKPTNYLISAKKVLNKILKERKVTLNDKTITKGDKNE